MKQEMNKLLELDVLHHPNRPILTEDGRTRLRDPATNQVVVGLKWEELVDRAPSFFSCKFDKVRNKELYGKAIHTEFVRISKQLGQPPHLRTVLRS